MTNTIIHCELIEKKSILGAKKCFKLDNDEFNI